MPALPFSVTLTANELGNNPLAGWQYEYVPAAFAGGAAIQLLMRATDVNTRVTVYSGSQTIQERSPIQGGGTLGTTPSELNTQPLTWKAAAGDRLKISIDEVAGGTPSVDGVITIEPVLA